MSTEAERMMALFQGFRGAHGTHGAEDSRPGAAKREIKGTAKTLRSPVTLELWEQHLAGARALGIIPINEEGVCWWGAVDIDSYDLVHVDLVRDLESRGIPCVVCRTKSGGAHVYVFLTESMPARDVMSRLRELAAAIGHGGSEIFPKQEQILADRGDLGNWLNMPYFGGSRTTRYAVGPDGRGLSVERFLDYCETIKTSPTTLLHLPLHRPVAEMSEGPPCLEHLASTKIGEGQRNNGLFALGVLAKKMHPDSWTKQLEKWNREYLVPPLPTSEVSVVVKSLSRKEYNYKCNDQPICAHCNLAVCRTRKYGVGPGGVARILESISVLETEPPLFFVSLRGGGTVECESESLLSPRHFQLAVMSQLLLVIPQYKQEDWHRQVQETMESAIRIEAPREIGVTGRFEELLERFCTDRHAAEERDGILLGKPWRDPETDLVWFRMRDLQDALERAKFSDLSRAQMSTRIREMGGTSAFFNIRGKGMNLWCVPGDRLTWIARPLETPKGEDSVI